jgi:hypothetical protein
MYVAVHVADALNEPPAIRKTRRTVPSSRRKRHFDPGKFHQRRLFVPPAGTTKEPQRIAKRRFVHVSSRFKTKREAERKLTRLPPMWIFKEDAPGLVET